MIQRIQSAYLLLAIILHVVLFMAPVLHVAEGVAGMGHGSYHVGLVADHTLGTLELRAPNLSTWQLIALVLNIAVLAVCVVAIFMYTNRKRQMRTVFFGVLLELLLLTMFALMYGTLTAGFHTPNDHIGIGWGFVLPVLGIVLLWLAIRGIRADERLVRSVDRLR